MFQNTTGTYADLSNQDFVYSSDSIWDDPWIPFANPFPNTQYDGVLLDSLAMGLGSDLEGFHWTTGNSIYIGAPGTDLIDRGFATSATTSQSQISYATTGSSPNRIFKMEWKNAGFYAEYGTTMTSNYYTNSQIWLREDGGIEMHFGNNNIDAAFNDTLFNWQELLCGFGVEDGAQVNDIHLLSGSSANPTLVSTFDMLTDYPAPGTVYKFVYPVSVNEQNTIQVDMYPNPAVNELRIKADADMEFDVKLIDISGQVVKTGNLSNSTVLNIADMPRGVYIVKLQDKNSDYTETLRLILK